MRIRDFLLTEGYAEDLNRIQNLLERDCKEILKVYKKTKKVFYRGTKKGLGGDVIELRRPRGNRKPLNTPIEAHEMLDSALKKKFGWKVRSEGVFATSTPGQAVGYGNAYVFVPIDGFKYVWNTSIPDVYIYIFDKPVVLPYSGMNIYLNHNERDKKEILKNEWLNYKYLKELEGDSKYSSFEEMEKNIEKELEETKKKRVKEVAETSTNKNIEKKLRSEQGEIAFKCRGYYLIDKDLKDYVIHVAENI